MKRFGIKTICLDEAHHLKNEWQKALEKFISAFKGCIKIISLTATLPYDSKNTEWSRYISICGEIDEEIFVPELVGQKTLCPHQDYIYFNYPTETETAALKKFKECAVSAVEEIGKLPFINDISEKLNREMDYEILFASVKEYIALLVLLRHYGLEPNKKLIRELTTKKGLPPFKMQYVETAIQFLLDGYIITEQQKNEIIGILKKYSVYDKCKVALELSEKLKRMLVSSVGKLESIKQIAKSEILSMGSRLRMLILTDYIKKENLAKIATGEKFNSVNVVSIFETLRRENYGVKIGVLSGSLVILPEEIDLSSVKCKKETITGTDYCTVYFSGSIQHLVDFVGELFEKGDIQILVGTKSLLGEGWDSPCINSLILASNVGSFVLSNQMRGRAIRVDKNDINKSSNIWHLVTVEPEYIFKDNPVERVKEYINQDKNVLCSYDFELLKRSFDTFMGPNYTTGEIESGIERITAISPPYDKNGIERINKEMLMLSTKREESAYKWNSEVSGGRFNVSVATEVPAEKRVPVFVFYNAALITLTIFAEVQAMRAFSYQIVKEDMPLSITSLVSILILAVIIFNVVKKLIFHINPACSLKTLGYAVYRTLVECGLCSMVD
jgi:hypothetical protein